MASKKMRVVSDEKKPQRPPFAKNPITYGLSVVLLGLIIVAFAYFPARGSRQVINNPYLLGTYGSKAINVNFTNGNYTYDIYRNYYSYYSYMFENGYSRQNPNSDNNLIASMWKSAYEATVYRYSMLDIAKKYGVIADKSIINSAIRQNEYQENGEFSRNLYDQTSRIERSAIEKKYTDNAVVDELESDLVSTSHISNAEKDYIDSIAGTEKQFEIIAFPLYDYPDSEVAGYAKENSDLFRKINLSKITITSDRNKAEELHRQLSENTSLFADKAKVESEDNYRSNGGSMGWSYSFYLEDDFQTAEDFNTVINLTRDEISPVIETDYGWVIYRCDEPARDADLTDPEDLQNIKIYISIFAAGEIDDYFLAQAASIRDLAIDRGMGWAAASIDKQNYISEFFPITFGSANTERGSLYKQPAVQNLSENFLSAISENQTLLERLNKLKLSEVSEPEVAGQYVLLFSLVNERKVDKEDLEQRPSDSLESTAQSYYVGDLRSYFLESDKLDDNFEIGIQKFLRDNFSTGNE